MADNNIEARYEPEVIGGDDYCYKSYFGASLKRAYAVAHHNLQLGAPVVVIKKYVWNSQYHDFEWSEIDRLENAQAVI